MRTKLRTTAIVAIGLLFAAMSVGAEAVRTAFTYQGQLKQGGVPVNTECGFDFRLWNSESGGDPIATLPTVIVPADEMVNGLFTVVLDFGAGVFNGEPRWLDISVSCPSGGSPVPLGRQELTPAPYAMHAPGGGTLWTLNGSDIYYKDGNVGIGLTDPDAKLHVNGAIKVGPSPNTVHLRRIK